MIRNTIIAILFSLGFGAISGAIKANEIIKQDHAKMEKEFLLKQYYGIENTLNQTKNTLTNYYINNIIYPKYLTMAGVAQILEYLESRRFNTLTGPDGAYNLYENELRMNKIIGNLDVIVKDLEEIKYTQYMIYHIKKVLTF